MLSEKANQEQKKKPFRKYGRKPEEEKGIPMLRYGKGNNFYKFRSFKEHCRKVSKREDDRPKLVAQDEDYKD